MDQQKLLEHIQTMITSSTKRPKHMAISSVKVADLFGVSYKEIEQTIETFVQEGSLIKSKLQHPPYSDVYQLPTNTSKHIDSHTKKYL